MKTSIRTCCALSLLPSLASAQLLTPVGQDRNVSAYVEAEDQGTIMSDTDSDSATGFGPFTAGASAIVDFSGGIGMAGGFLDSQILPDSFIADGSSSSSSFGCEDWDWRVTGESLAQIDFEVTSWVHYELTGFIEGYDQGYASWELIKIGTGYIDGYYGFAKGVILQNSRGTLDPGTYRLHYFADSDTGHSGCDQGYAFAAYDLAFVLTEVSASYCTTNANSTGASATLAMGGTPEVSENNFHVLATGAVPGQFGLVYYGTDQVQMPFGDGYRCVGGQTWRLNPPQIADAGGSISQQVDFTSGPAGSGQGQILPWSTWNFQLWYRDPLGPGGSGFNLSDGMWVTFCP